MLRISNIKLSIHQEESELRNEVIKLLKINDQDLLELQINKSSIDARKTNQIFYIYTVDVAVKNEEQVVLGNGISKIEEVEELTIQPVDNYSKRPVVVGFGPAGMFAALVLARANMKPIVIERGESVDQRKETVDLFWDRGILNGESNVQFGEGGAGTFSDGKLTARIKDTKGKFVLAELVNHGAPKEIMHMAHPHVGTDLLMGVVKSIREEIISLGGEVRFSTKVEDFEINNQEITGVVLSNGEHIDTNEVVVAIGHSARDTYEQLYNKGIEMAQKPFAVGFRVEHPQQMINQNQFGELAKHPRLKAAEYRLTHQTSNEKGTYTFCMCPGGYVVASSSEEGMVVTNGMSYHSRAGQNANSAVLVQVDETDFGSDHPLAGIEFQRNLERKAFELGGGNYSAPIQVIEDYLNKKVSRTFSGVKPTYSIGTKFADINQLFSDKLNTSLHEGLLNFDRKIRGFKKGLITGVESRSSAPVRIVRDQHTLMSVNTKNLYPAGEGAGYAGGIVTSALDGVKIALNIIESYQQK